MRKNLKDLFFILPAFCLWSCDSWTPPDQDPECNPENKTQPVPKTNVVLNPDSILPLEQIENSSLKKWISYYKNKYPGFSPDSFKFQEATKDDFLIQQGDMDEGDLKLYKSLLIFSPDGKKIY
jgi:hypothetical protein